MSRSHFSSQEKTLSIRGLKIKLVGVESVPIPLGIVENGIISCSEPGSEDSHLSLTESSLMAGRFLGILLFSRSSDLDSHIQVDQPDDRDEHGY